MVPGMKTGTQWEMQGRAHEDAKIESLIRLSLANFEMTNDQIFTGGG